jgi:hypothetical protein
MSRINAILTADGRHTDVSHLAIDSSELQSMASTSKTLGFNLYNAKDAPFCIGSKAYSSAHSAHSNASTRKGNHFGSFAVEFNERRGTMKLIGASEQRATYVRYAVFNGRTFEKPSFATSSEARRTAGSRGIVVAIGVRGRDVVSVSVV